MSKQNPFTATAIIVAAGSGTRMKNNLNKQLIIIGDKPVLAHTLLKFQMAETIANIIIVTKPENIITVNDIISEFGISKATDIVPGGETRQESVMCGLSCVDNADVVAVHDGARPFVSPQKIDETVNAAFSFGGAALGVLPKDTIKEVANDGNVLNTFNRSQLRLIQTPQAFRTDIIKLSYIRAKEDGFSGTDDCSIVEHSGFPVKIIDGDYTNIKITTPEDLPVAEAIHYTLLD